MHPFWTCVRFQSVNFQLEGFARLFFQELIMPYLFSGGSLELPHTAQLSVVLSGPLASGAFQLCQYRVSGWHRNQSLRYPVRSQNVGHMLHSILPSFHSRERALSCISLCLLYYGSFGAAAVYPDLLCFQQPRHLECVAFHLCSETGVPENTPWGSPLKRWGIKWMLPLFLSPGTSYNLEVAPVCSVLSWGEG